MDSNNKARQRLLDFFDPDSFFEIGRYVEDNQKQTSLICGYGEIQGSRVNAFVQNGSICKANIAKMKKIYDLAEKTSSPLIGFYDSNGLDLSEGIQLLDEFGELLRRQNNLSGVVPQVSVIVGTCISVNAMLACSADFIIMSQSASFYTSPTSFDSSENIGTARSSSESGVAHIVVEEKEVLTETQKLAFLLAGREKTGIPFEEPENGEALLMELSKDITKQDPMAIVTGFSDLGSLSVFYPEFGTNVLVCNCSIGGRTVGVVSTNGESLTADDCVKIARLAYVWDSLNIPIITTINTDGMALASPSATRDFAKVAHVYAEATVPKIAIITGKAYGAGYVTLASRSVNSDYTVAWPTAIISPLPPHTSVAFLQGDMINDGRSREDIIKSYIEGEASALTAAKKGVLDDVIKPEKTRKLLINMLNTLSNKKVIKPCKKHGNIPF